MRIAPLCLQLSLSISILACALAGAPARAQSLPPGGLYLGTLVNGQRAGLGTYLTPEGERFEGQFLNGEPHGFGVLWDSSGFSLRQCGLWLAGQHELTALVPRRALPTPNHLSNCLTAIGQPIQDFEMVRPDGAFYVGSVDAAHLPHGQGFWLRLGGRAPEGGTFVHGLLTMPIQMVSVRPPVGIAPPLAAVPDRAKPGSQAAQTQDCSAPRQFPQLRPEQQEQVRLAVLAEQEQRAWLAEHRSSHGSATVCHDKVAAGGTLHPQDPAPAERSAAVLRLPPAGFSALQTESPAPLLATEADLADLEAGWLRTERRILELLADEPEPSPLQNDLQEESLQNGKAPH
jgi:hypothetical protein